MALFGFEKDTLLDLTVNVIPLGIILFFIAAFAVVNPFGLDPVFSGLQFSLMVSMFLLLAVLTYYAGRAIEGAEEAVDHAAIEEPNATSGTLDEDDTVEEEAELTSDDDELPEA
ncbi:DUF6684 family protein [Haloarcula onubensis]|uniref:Cox cluster protein n=1 Tax=Haloarcula onubensis TaxID=2950539 RepID=A0ABU2FQA9_9EURY|nr:hypothetical protein [Halomicroarcula sp. S3CR25-11]